VAAVKPGTHSTFKKHSEEFAQMHDRNGTELRQGDVVLIPAVITGLSPGEDYCNVSLQTVHGRRPDDAKEYIGAINTGVCILHDRPNG
jgi:hypothetical protein